MLLGTVRTYYETGDGSELPTLLASTTGMLGSQLCAINPTLCNVDNQTQGSYVLGKHYTKLYFPPILLDICMYVCMYVLCIFLCVCTCVLL